MLYTENVKKIHFQSEYIVFAGKLKIECALEYSNNNKFIYIYFLNYFDSTDSTINSI